MVCDKMEDVSNKVIFILVILTVVISIFSTVLMLSADSDVTKSKVSAPANSGKISYHISEPSNAVATGRISFAIE